MRTDDEGDSDNLMLLTLIFLMVLLAEGCMLPGTFSCFLKLEEALTTKFIPALTGHDPPAALQHSLFALPARFGGLGIIVQDSLSSSEFSASLSVTASLRSHKISITVQILDADSFQVSKRSNI